MQRRSLHVLKRKTVFLNSFVQSCTCLICHLRDVKVNDLHLNCVLVINTHISYNHDLILK